jgi:hypothetical protein
VRNDFNFAQLNPPIVNKYFIILLFTAFSLSLLNFPQARSQGNQVKVACVAFYNLENLFDTIDDPLINDDEFTPRGTGKWDSQRYRTKLEHLARVISQIGDEYTKGGPVMMGVSEVENLAVMEDLVKTPPLDKAGYKIVHYDSPDKRGIDVGFIYQPKYFTVTGSKAIPLRIEGKDNWTTRDILQVSGTFDGEPMYVLVNHWPSRSSGERETAPLRNAAADLCRKSADAIMQEHPGAKIIIMGDLNDDPVDESLMKHLKVKTKPDNVGAGDLFDPMWQLFKDGTGSLAYRDSWNLFDQVIVSGGLMDKSGTGYKFYKAKVFNRKFLLQEDGQYAGYPFRTYAGGVYMAGYSDHLPVYIYLVKKVD